MGKFSFEFKKSIVSIKGKNIYIDIKDDEKNKRFTSEFLSSLQRKYSDFNFHINKLKDKVITANKTYKIYSNNKLKVGMEIESVGRIATVDCIQKNNNFYYDILIENINNSTALKLYGVFSEKVDFLNENNYIIFKGKVIEVNKKEYENQIDFNKNIIKLSNVDLIEKDDIRNIIKKTGTLRRPICVSSSLGQGFIDDEKIKKRENEISGYCITDVNTLNFVENKNMDIPLGIKAYVEIENRFYSVYIYVNSKDSEIEFCGHKIKVNEGIRIINTMISNSTKKYNGAYVFNVVDLLENKKYFRIGSLDHDGLVYISLLENNFNLLEQYMELFDVVAIEPIETLSAICNKGYKNGAYSNLKNVNELIRRLSIKYKIPLLFNESPIVVDIDDREFAREYFISNKIREENIKDRDKFIEEQRRIMGLSNFQYIRSTPEIVEELSEQGFELTDIELIIFESLMFEASLPKKSEITIIPNFLFVDDNKESKLKLKDMVKYNLIKKQLSNNSEIVNRVKEELKIIFKNNYQKVFLAAATISKRSRDFGYTTGDRGTAGCMMLCYVLGISNTNPLDFNLDYRMFLGPNYEKVPDIDINISSNIVKEISNELKTYFPNTMKASIASYYKENSVKSQILLKTGAKGLDVYYACYLMNGKLSRIQPHNSGIMLLPDNIDINYIFPTISYNDEKVPGYPYEYLEKTIPKVDILSKNDMDILKDINEYKNINDISLNDKNIYKFINRDTSEISELNTDYARKIIDIIHPNSFDDLVIIQGLLHGRGVLNSAQRCLKNKLKAIACREDLLELLEKNNIKNSFDIMEKIRKGNYHKLTDDEKEDLKKLPIEYQKSLEEIQYLFPKSHAISYAKQAYYTAYYIMNKDEILKNKNINEEDTDLCIEDLDEFIGEEF